MRILIAGFGSIGQRHAKNCVALDAAHELAVLRSGHGPIDDSDLRKHYTLFTDVASALQWRPDAVILANPAPFHIESAMRFIEEGCHIFIEKPIATDQQDVPPLLRAAESKGVVLMVGYMLRFFEPLCVLKHHLDAGAIGAILSVRASVGQYLPEWRRGRAYQETVSARKELGGGVLLELSHEFDYLRWLCGDVTAVRADAGTVSDLDIDVEDTADIILHFASGFCGNVHLDMVDRAAHRECRVVGSTGTILWESQEGNRVRLYDGATRAWRDLRPAGDIDRNAMYQEELQHFIECIDGKKQPLVTGEDGRRALAIVRAVREAAVSGARILL